MLRNMTTILLSTIYFTAIFTFLRGRRNTYHHTTLLKLDAVNDTEASNFYLGKRVAFIYKSKVAKAGSKFRGV